MRYLTGIPELVVDTIVKSECKLLQQNGVPFALYIAELDAMIDNDCWGFFVRTQMDDKLYVVPGFIIVRLDGRYVVAWYKDELEDNEWIKTVKVVDGEVRCVDRDNNEVITNIASDVFENINSWFEVIK